MEKAKLFKLIEDYQIAAAEIAAKQAVADAMKAAIKQAMSDANVTTVVTDSNVVANYVVSEKLTFNEAALIPWCKDHGFKYLVKEALDTAALKDSIKKKFVDRQLIEDMISVDSTISLKVSK